MLMSLLWQSVLMISSTHCADYEYNIPVYLGVMGHSHLTSYDGKQVILVQCTFLIQNNKKCFMEASQDESSDANLVYNKQGKVFVKLHFI